ncbi:MAG: acetyltransferase [Deltaproteobacteria bacterium]|nr:acetyltransferase [Deltaproteobacteria bacterium]
MKKLLIFPYNGNAIESLDCIDSEFEFIGFIDDSIDKQIKRENDHRVFGRTILDKYEDAFLLIVPGSPTTFLERKKIIDNFNIKSERLAQIIHPKACISPLAKIGKNVLIMAGVVVTSNAIIGNHVCILPNTVIHHDVRVNDYCLIGSNITIAGYATIGINCYIGSGTSIINGVEIGDRTMIGMGSNVIRNIDHNCIAVGNPCHIVTRRQQ